MWFGQVWSSQMIFSPNFAICTKFTIYLQFSEKYIFHQFLEASVTCWKVWGSFKRVETEINCIEHQCIISTIWIPHLNGALQIYCIIFYFLESGPWKCQGASVLKAQCCSMWGKSKFRIGLLTSLSALLVWWWQIGLGEIYKKKCLTALSSLSSSNLEGCNFSCSRERKATR